MKIEVTILIWRRKKCSISWKVIWKPIVHWSRYENLPKRTQVMLAGIDGTKLVVDNKVIFSCWAGPVPYFWGETSQMKHPVEQPIQHTCCFECSNTQSSMCIGLDISATSTTTSVANNKLKTCKRNICWAMHLIWFHCTWFDSILFHRIWIDSIGLGWHILDAMGIHRNTLMGKITRVFIGWNIFSICMSAVFSQAI